LATFTFFSNFVSKNKHEPIELVSTDTFWVTSGYPPPMPPNETPDMPPATQDIRSLPGNVYVI